MARNPFARILQSKDKGVSNTSGANGVLSRLWRQMLYDLNIGGPRYGNLMHDFVTDIRNGYPPTRRDQTSARGNLTKEFARPQMTWKVFMKGLRFLQIEEVEFAIRCKHRNGKITTHGTMVDFGSRAMVNRFLEELDVEFEQDEDIDLQQVRDFITSLAQSNMFPFEIDPEDTQADLFEGESPQPHKQPVRMTADVYESRTFPDGRIEPTFDERVNAGADH
ncbi:hypothetical protein [Paraburkholderia sp. BCC1886]|uniref:hypothetical protein n=1 Tax=Paraburkholderia sp. BCC1886 TaxID=2562670 RepID=UPI001184328C|nr:hypothetical protein [Paraburkholderia sp. BCC1886]